MPDFLPVGLQNIMHRWQPGLPEVGRKDSPLSYISAMGLCFLKSECISLKTLKHEDAIPLSRTRS
jgi:hypothetical protein